MTKMIPADILQPFLVIYFPSPTMRAPTNDIMVLGIRKNLVQFHWKFPRARILILGQLFPVIEGGIIMIRVVDWR